MVLYLLMPFDRPLNSGGREVSGGVVPATWEGAPARSDVTGNAILTSIHGHGAKRYKTFQFLSS